jgi:hypothetical protein
VYVSAALMKQQYQAAAKLFLASPGVKTIAAACKQRGLGESGSDYQGVRRWVQNYKDDGSSELLKKPDVAARVLAQVDSTEAPSAVPRPGFKVRKYGDMETDEDFQDYTGAYMRIGRLMSGRAPLTYKAALAIIERETFWTISRSCAYEARKGKPPNSKGRPLSMGIEADDAMVRGVKLLRAMQLPTRKNIVINMATNMVATAGLKIKLTSAGRVPDGWFYRFRDRHKDLFEFKASRGLEDTRAEWLTSANASTHYGVMASAMLKAGIVRRAVLAEEMAVRVNGETMEYLSEEDKARMVSFDECRSTLDTYQDCPKGKELVIGDDDHTLEVRGNGNVTVVCGSRADGMALPPMCIFPRTTMGQLTKPQKGWSLAMLEKWAKEAPTSDICGTDGKKLQTLIFGNKSGGMTDDCGAMYLEHIIVPSLPKLTADKPGILVCDGHGSHLTLKFLETAIENHIVVVLRPPHTTSRLQGEDTKFGFGTFQSIFRTEKEALLVDCFLKGEKPSIWGYMGVMKKAYEGSFTRENCRKSWDKIGIVPFTRRVFWELASEERVRASAKADAENKSDKAEVLEEMDMAKMCRARVGASAAAEEEEEEEEEDDEDDEEGEDESSSDEDETGRFNSSRAWKKPATCAATMKILKKKDKKRRRAAEDKSAKAEARATKALKVHKEQTAVGTAALASFKDEQEWRPIFNKLKLAQLDGVRVVIGVKEPIKGKKQDVLTQLAPLVEEFMEE